MDIVWAKLENGVPVINTERYIRNKIRGVNHSNPTEEQYFECGYKKLIKDDTVLEEKKGYRIVTKTEETDTEIIIKQSYEEIVEDISEEVSENAENIEI